MKIYQILIILILSSNIIFSKDIKINEELIPIGFNDNHYFAYLKKGYEDGMGCFYWQSNIKNILNNKNVNSIKSSMENCLPNSDTNISKSFLKKQEILLKKYSINRPKDINIKKFPLIIQDKNIDAKLITLNKITDESITTIKKNIILKSTNKIKKIGSIHEVLFYGQPKYSNFKILGYIISHKNRDTAILIISYKIYGDMEINSFKLFGFVL